MSDKVELTSKQQKFCDEYLVDLNGTQAAIRAGYSEHTAKQIATENLSKPYLQEYLTGKKQEVQARTNITVDYVVNGIKDIAELGESETNRLRAFDLLGKHVGAYEKDNEQSKPNIVTAIEVKYV